MKLNLLTLVTFVFFIASCSILDDNSEQGKIVGQWEWIRSSGGIFGEISTPDSAGVPSRLFKFKFDNTFSFFRADTLVKKGKYALHEEDGEIIINYKSPNDNYFFNQRVKFKGDDTLILADECYDCYINTYIRAN